MKIKNLESSIMKSEKMKSEKMKRENIKTKKTKSEKKGNERKRIILYILIGLILLTIFIFSEQPGKKSESTSDAFAGTIIDKVTEITNTEITNSKKKYLIVSTRFIVRKSAHFSIYLILGILIYQLLKTYHIKKIVIISILICFILGCIDEFHQMFIPARTARFYDCIIDTSGSSVGILIIYLIDSLKIRKTIKE